MNRQIWKWLLVLISSGCLLFCTPRRHGDREWPAETHRDTKNATNDITGQTPEDPTYWNVRIRLRMIDRVRKKHQSGSINWSVGGLQTQAGGGTANLSDNGVRIGVLGKNASLEVEGRSDRNTIHRRRSLQITVMNGTTGMLRLTKMRSEPINIKIYGSGGRRVVQRYNVKSTGMYLRVRPEILDEGPEMKITLEPMIARDGKNAVEVSELRTTVHVRNGQRIVLKKTSSRSEKLGNSLFSARSASERRNTLWILEPEILK